MRLVKIEWVDSRQPVSSWQLLSDLEIKDPCNCVSVGYLLESSDQVKILAPNVAEFHSKTNIQASGIMVIPACSVTKITDLSAV